GPGRRHGNEFADLAAYRIFQVIKLPVLRLLFLDLEIRQNRPVTRAPIDDPRPAVYPPLFVKPDKNLAHRYRKALIHRESLTTPIDRDPLAPHLAGYLTAVLLFPLPNLLGKCIAANILRGLVLVFFELPRHH